MEWKHEVNSVSINLRLPRAFFTLPPIKIDQDDFWQDWLKTDKSSLYLNLILLARTNSCFCEPERLLGDRHQIWRCFAQELKISTTDVRRQLARREKYHLDENIKWMTEEKKNPHPLMRKYLKGMSAGGLIIHRKYKHHSSWKCSPVITSNTHSSPRSGLTSCPESHYGEEFTF